MFNSWSMHIRMEFKKTPPYKCRVKSIIQFLLKDLKWYKFAHMVQSPDLVVFNFHLLPRVKMDLGGKWFSTHEELITEVSTIMWNYGEEFYCNGIQNLIPYKCLSYEGDYIEKWYELSLTYINFLAIFVLVFLFYKNSPMLLLERPSYNS